MTDLVRTLRKAFDREFGKACDVYGQIGLEDMVLPFPDFGETDLSKNLGATLNEGEGEARRVREAVVAAHSDVRKAIRSLARLSVQ